MKILSIKNSDNRLSFKLFNMDNEEVISYGRFEHIGSSNGRYFIKYGNDKYSEDIIINDYNNASKILTEKLLSLNIIESIDDIDAIGHYVLFGEEKDPVIINNEVLEKIKSNKLSIDNALGIEAFMELMPNKMMVAVFDNSYHHTIEDINYLYPVPINWYKNYGIRKYGFNGISHEYISSEVSNIIGDNYKLISVDLDRDSSVCAIDSNKSINVSSGFSLVGGVMSGVRSGNIDPSIIPYVMEKEGKNAGEIIDDLNNKSGLIGVSEISDDIYDIVDASNNGNIDALRAKDMYVRSIVNYIGAYYLLLGGCDIIVFSSTHLDKHISIRREICEKLGVLGIKIDLDLNQSDKIMKISTEDSKIQVYIIPNNEGLMVSRKTMDLVRNGN